MARLPLSHVTTVVEFEKLSDIILILGCMVSLVSYLYTKP